MISILIVDDHAIVRRGIKGILSESGSVDVIGEAADYGEMRALMQKQLPEMILLDVGLPGKNGIDTLKFLKDAHPEIKVLMLSLYPEDQYAVRALKAGAFGYLNKASAPEQLMDAIKQIMGGRKYITPEIAQALVENLGGGNGDALPHTKLSDREYQTPCLMASGKKLSDIAESLALSPKTVSVYRARILEKMTMQNNAELTHYALKHGLVE